MVNESWAFNRDLEKGRYRAACPRRVLLVSCRPNSLSESPDRSAVMTRASVLPEERHVYHFVDHGMHPRGDMAGREGTLDNLLGEDFYGDDNCDVASWSVLFLSDLDAVP